MDLVQWVDTIGYELQASKSSAKKLHEVLPRCIASLQNLYEQIPAVAREERKNELGKLLSAVLDESIMDAAINGILDKEFPVAPIVVVNSKCSKPLPEAVEKLVACLPRNKKGTKDDVIMSGDKHSLSAIELKKKFRGSDGLIFGLNDFYFSQWITKLAKQGKVQKRGNKRWTRYFVEI